MKKKLTILVIGLLVSFTQTQAQWTQIGNDIDGTEEGDRFGAAVSINNDGTIVAIGSNNNEEEEGMVRIYENNEGAWVLLEEINNNVSEANFGFSLSLNSDGSVIAIGAPFAYSTSGFVSIYENIEGTWTEVGGKIYGEDISNRSGYSVSLNGDGSIVAIGATLNSDNGSMAGHARVYENIEGTWTQIGQDIDGAVEDDKFGTSISINDDGSIVAIGAIDNDANGENSGHVRIFENIEGTWTQIGQDINGDEVSEQFGRSVSLSADGSIVAIGANGSDGSITNAGQVSIYENNNGTWTQIGEDIYGESANDNSGYSISLSDDGSKVAIGAYKNGVHDKGHVRVYENIEGTWTQVGEDIDGEANDDQSGFAVSLSGDGTTVIIGAALNDDNGLNAGHARVYEQQSLNISTLQSNGISIYPNPSNGIFNIECNNKAKIRITDLTGKEIQELSTVNNMLSIDISKQPKGIYIINFEIKNRTVSTKIIIE